LALNRGEWSASGPSCSILRDTLHPTQIDCPKLIWTFQRRDRRISCTYREFNRISLTVQPTSWSL